MSDIQKQTEKLIAEAEALLNRAQKASESADALLESADIARLRVQVERRHGPQSEEHLQEEARKVQARILAGIPELAGHPPDTPFVTTRTRRGKNRTLV